MVAADARNAEDYRDIELVTCNNSGEPGLRASTAEGLDIVVADDDAPAPFRPGDQPWSGVDKLVELGGAEGAVAGSRSGGSSHVDRV